MCRRGRNVNPVLCRPVSWSKNRLEKTVKDIQAEDSGAQKGENALLGEIRGGFKEEGKPKHMMRGCHGLEVEIRRRRSRIKEVIGIHGARSPRALDSKLRSVNVTLLAARSRPREFLNSGVS